ncbi:flavin reductase family protein [Streptacidiphilus sp. PB12-B1b]|uniref:flavin reductase family protein n=1 Tax=Streptacidiphilus sp. PB12-B1b TaxID=2705012 RepID=UPI0015FBD9C4|nr:flavin reductase family protein [Streptacidiphilus sp. PB12-B1b]
MTTPAADHSADPAAGTAAAPGPGEVGPEEFRAALGQLASGVVLLTAHDPEEGARGEDIGMTATAFLSVSLEPPLVLVSVREDSRMEETLSRVDHWAVSVLAAEQRVTAARFAMKGRVSDRLLFAELPHERGAASGAPLATGALATVECRTEQRIPAGDHVLLIGRVLSARIAGPENGPLMHFRGQYRQLD